MDSSSESLLHGGIEDSKSCDQHGLSEAQHYILGKRSKNNDSSLRILSCISLTLNIIFLTSVVILWGKATQPRSTEYGAGLVRDVPIEWNPYSLYGTGNKDEINRSIMWESLDASLGEVSLDKQWARNHGLPPAQPFPWDQSRSLYLLNGHHSLHCMRKIRRWVTIGYHNGTQLDGYPHLVHCVDHLLQNIICDADDTPMYTTQTKNKDAGLHQARMCRSWEALNRWAETQTSCYVFVNETQGVDNTFNRYKWCPEGSPYAGKMVEHMRLPGGWYEERPAEIDSMPPYWKNFTQNVFTFHEATEN